MNKKTARIAVSFFLSFLALLAAVELSLQAASLWAEKSLIRRRGGSSGVPVILCLGDSHTYGAGVDEEETYPARLQELLREKGYRVSVVNLGAPGMNTSEIRRRLPRWLKTYKPSVIILLASVNNGWNRKDASWSDLKDGLQVSWKAMALDFAFEHIKTLKAFAVLFHRLRFARSPEELAKDRKGRLILHRREETWKVESAEKAFQRALRDLAAIIAKARAAHAEVILMTYATDPEYTFEMPNRILRETAQRMKAPLLDNDRAFRQILFREDGRLDPEARKRLFFPDMHPKAPAYRVIAENLLAFMEQEKITRLFPRTQTPP